MATRSQPGVIGCCSTKTASPSDFFKEAVSDPLALRVLMTNGIGWQDAGSRKAWFGPSRDRFRGLSGSGKHGSLCF